MKSLLFMTNISCVFHIFHLFIFFLIFFLFVVNIQTTFNLEDFQNIPPLPPCGVECLSLYTDALPSKYAALLDGIFWICFPKFLSITSGGENRNKFIKVCSSYHKCYH